MPQAKFNMPIITLFCVESWSLNTRDHFSHCLLEFWAYSGVYSGPGVFSTPFHLGTFSLLMTHSPGGSSTTLPIFFSPSHRGRSPAFFAWETLAHPILLVFNEVQLTKPISLFAGRINLIPEEAKQKHAKPRDRAPMISEPLDVSMFSHWHTNGTSEWPSICTLTYLTYSIFEIPPYWNRRASSFPFIAAQHSMGWMH